MDVQAAPRTALRPPALRLPHRLLRLAGDDRLVEHVRAGSVTAFEVAFDRHHRGMLGLCRHMLGSVEEAEDAVQHTFMAAYRELKRTDRPVQLRPWLYAIARNRCLDVLRARREQPLDSLDEPATEHLSSEVQRRQDLRDLLGDVASLPVDQRSALVLAELGDVSHEEIAQVLGCPREKVKALVFQARTSLSASRDAREASCLEMREQLASLRGGSLRRTTLSRHLRECPGCREFRGQLRAQRRALAAVLPVAPTLGLKEAALGAALGTSTTAGLATGTFAAKALVVAAVAGGGTAAGVEAIREPARPTADGAAAAPGGPEDRWTVAGRDASGRAIVGPAGTGNGSAQGGTGGNPAAGGDGKAHGGTGGNPAAGGDGKPQRGTGGNPAATGNGKGQGEPGNGANPAGAGNAKGPGHGGGGEGHAKGGGAHGKAKGGGPGNGSPAGGKAKGGGPGNGNPAGGGHGKGKGHAKGGGAGNGANPPGAGNRKGGRLANGGPGNGANPSAGGKGGPGLNPAGGGGVNAKGGSGNRATPVGAGNGKVQGANPVGGGSPAGAGRGQGGEPAGVADARRNGGALEGAGNAREPAPGGGVGAGTSGTAEGGVPPRPGQGPRTVG